MYLEWEERFSVKIKNLDEQHQSLFTVINAMHDAVERGEGFKVLTEILERMLSYTENHFSCEEKYMLEYAYPHFNEQKEDHEYFIDRVNSFKKGLDDRKFGLPKEVLQFLKSWWIAHILNKDRQYSNFFLEKGLA